MIQINEEAGVIALHTASTTYAMGVADGRYLGHLYYGSRLYLSEADLENLRASMRLEEAPAVPSEDPGEKSGFLDAFPFEYPTGGIGDNHEPCLDIVTEAGQTGLELHWSGYRVCTGKRPLPGLPGGHGGKQVEPGESVNEREGGDSYGSAEAVQTLEIDLLSEGGGLLVTLIYGVFEKADVITRAVRICNRSKKTVFLTRALSFALFMDDEQRLEVMTMGGAWARERRVVRQKLEYGALVNESLRGESGHQTQPFMALVTPETTQRTGKVYAALFAYSGNFLSKVQVDEQRQIQIVMGIHPGTFHWMLAPGEIFDTPEVVLTCSECGLDGMTAHLHDFCRRHILRGSWVHRERPVLINSWEAMYFDISADRLLALAREAKEVGIEMLVVDDGWYGRRSRDEGSLGDWSANPEKFPGGLASFARQIHALGLRLGLWFEPEMVSGDSDLYRAHPDWMLRTAHHVPSMGRNQYVLDLANPSVVQYLCEALDAVIGEAQLDYIKWDMNRSITDFGSSFLPPQRQGETAHRYVLGLYKVQEHLVRTWPELLLENCSSGGARFDLGMLYYSPQIWCSDDMDPVERLPIIEGTAMLYPPSVIGAHISRDHNDVSQRTTRMEDRARMACLGTFGYELDLASLPRQLRSRIPAQIARHRELAPLVLEGDYYRIASYRENQRYDCAELVSKDRGEAAVFLFFVLGEPSRRSLLLHLEGLEEASLYQVYWDEESDQVQLDEGAGGVQWGTSKPFGEHPGQLYRGSVLMYAGIVIPRPRGDFHSLILRLHRKEDRFGRKND